MIRKLAPILFTLLALSASIKVVSQTQFRETVWLQVNRDIYIAGEDVHYNVSLLENDTYKPSALSKNIRLELIDENGKNIIRKNIELNNSAVSGKITLPSNLETGVYSIISYTNWMRNFPVQDFSSHRLRILNSDDTNRDSLILHNSRLNIELNPYTDPDDPSLMKCSIYTTNSYKEALSTQGVILSGPGDTVMTFQTDNTGWGTSYYRPADPNKYQIFAMGFERENIDFKLLSKESKLPGSSISEKYGYLNINLVGTVSGQTYKVLVHRLYSWSWFHTLEASSDNLMIRIPVRDLPSGISQCVVLDSNNDILLKRLWSDYREESSKVGIDIEASYLTPGNEYSANYYTDGNFGEDASNSLHLIADIYVPGSRFEYYLPGLPGWPANYEIPASQEAFEGWIIKNSYPDEIIKAFFLQNPESPLTSSANKYKDNIEYYPETRGGILSGVVLNKSDRSPVANKYIALSILNDNSFYAAKTDSKGKFVFTFPDQSGPRDYLFNFIEEFDPSWQVEIQDDFADLSAESNNLKATFTLEELEFLRNSLLNTKLKDLYFPEQKEDVQSSDTLLMHDLFYGEADISVRVEDYVRLSNLREVIFEVVPYVNINQNKKKYNLKVSGDNIFTSEYPTLILFDGIPVYDYQDFLNLPPERIKSINAINNFYIHGNAIFEGLIDINSVNKDFGGLSMPENTILSTFMLPQREKYIPHIAEKPEKSHLPSLDQILEWKILSERSSGKESIYFNHNPGPYNIFVYGFDLNGKWHSGRIIKDN
mgnify:CR=1 FL=1